MQISSNLASSYMATERRNATPLPSAASGTDKTSTPTFDNMTPAEMKAARETLSDEGKLDVFQNGRMMLMDGEMFQSMNGGQLVAGSTNMYKLIDQQIEAQKQNGDSFNAKADVAAYQSLASLLHSYDQKETSATDSIA